MQTGFYSATGGMVAQFTKLDNTTNNLANMNTAGFKKDEVIFGDYLRLAQEKRDNLPLENHTRESAKYYNRNLARVPQVNDQFTDFTVGTIKQSSNTLDLALSEKDLFFVIQTPAGNRLTRNGAFTTNGDGFLVTKEGYKVLDSSMQPVEIDLNQNINFDKNGSFANGDNVGEIMIVQPENLRTLQKEGSNLYILPNENEFIHLGDNGAVRQGYLETSNVNGVIEMANLIETNRMVSMYQKVMDTQMNEINRDAIEKVASTR